MGAIFELIFFSLFTLQNSMAVFYHFLYHYFYEYETYQKKKAVFFLAKALSEWLCKLGHISDRKKRQKRATFWSFTAFTLGIYKVFFCWHVKSSILKHILLCDEIYKWNLWLICAQNGRNRPRLRKMEIQGLPSQMYVTKTTYLSF